MAARVAHPESIVETDWVADNLGDDKIVLVEVDVDTEAYDQGHIAGAVGWNWTTQLNDGLTRDILSKQQVQRLMGDSGITKAHTVILYGDNNNWFATYAWWQLRLYGHKRLKMMNRSARAISRLAASVARFSSSCGRWTPTIRSTFASTPRPRPGNRGQWTGRP